MKGFERKDFDKDWATASEEEKADATLDTVDRVLEMIIDCLRDEELRQDDVA